MHARVFRGLTRWWACSHAQLRCWYGFPLLLLTILSTLYSCRRHLLRLVPLPQGLSWVLPNSCTHLTHSQLVGAALSPSLRLPLLACCSYMKFARFNFMLPLLC